MSNGIVLITCLATLSATSVPGAVPIYERWEQAVALRGQRQYAEAESVLRSIIGDHLDEEDFVRRAWCEIIFTLMLAGDIPGQNAAAQDALRAFPDLEADTLYIPGAVNDLLTANRNLMYGSVRIREPEDATVYLDGVEVGPIPILLPYVEVGRHELRVTRDGFDDYTEVFEVTPEGRHLFEKIDLHRRKNATYWLTRIGTGAVLAGTIVLIAGGDDGGTAPQPLAGPPAVPDGR